MAAISRGIRKLHQLSAAAIGLLAGVAVSEAAAETYSREAQFEISGVGSRTSRSCTVALIPSQTFGASPPRLTLVTSRPDRISVDLAESVRFREPVVVRNNVRRSFAPLRDASRSQLLASAVWKGITSGKPFFITAKRLDTGEFVSSRYEAIDVNRLLTQIEANCPYDAEALMADTSERARRERALNVSTSDLTKIRWLLRKRFAQLAAEPRQESSLLMTERAYLKRYALEAGLPVSGYLTSAIVSRLLADAVSLAPPPPPPPPPSEYFTFTLCNKSRVTIALATSSRVSPSDSNFNVEGWWMVPRGECSEIGRFPKGWFYFYGEQKGSGKIFWSRNDLKLCVTYPGPFKRVNKTGYTCKSANLKGFISVFVEKDQDSYSFTMNP